MANMNVKKLIEYLKAFPDNTEIIISSDAEGNSYSPLVDYGGEYIYAPEGGACGDGGVYDPEDEEDYAYYKEKYPDKEDRKDHKKVVCFWPV